MHTPQSVRQQPASVEFLSDAEADRVWGGTGGPTQDAVPDDEEAGAARGGRATGVGPRSGRGWRRH